MSRRGGPNAVRGPTSALTAFLREQGINTGPISSYGRLGGANAQTQGGDDEAAEAGPSNSNNASTTGRRRGAVARDAEDYNSDNLDESDGEVESKSNARGKKRKAELELVKAKAKAKAAAKRRKTGGGGDEDEEDEEDEDEYTAPSKGKKITNNKPPTIGGFEDCVECGKKFTVTKYTVAATPPPGYLCHECAKAAGGDPFKKAAPKKRKAAQERRKITNFEEKERIPSLASLCISIISTHIDDVEALGDIGSYNMDAISKILAKNRSLNVQNVPLFYDVKNTNLTLYECTALEPSALCALASLNPNLQSLRLDFCGRMDGTVLDHWGAHLKSLTRLELLGPFCVRKDAWIRFFEVIGSRLEGFLIVNSPRFDLDCAKSLATHCSESLTELRLSEVEHLNEGFIPPMANFQSLTSLDLSYPSESISDDMAITLLSAVGGKLTSLNLSGNDLLTDEALIKGVQPYTRQLDTFVMACVPLLTDDGVAEFFSSYIASKQIKNISLSRNHLPSSNALTALLSHSGTELKELDVNCWRDASVESLMQIGEKAKYLKKLDVGWCRNMDDFVVKAVLDGCPMVEEIKCFGCNRITENCPRKRGVTIRGFEGHTA